MNKIASKMLKTSPVLALSLAMLAGVGTAEAAKRKADDWFKIPGVYTPDEIIHHRSLDTCEAKLKPASNKTRTASPARKIKTARKVARWDWQVNPRAYAPDGLTDYSVVDVEIERSLTSGPAAYAPDALTDYSDYLKVAPSA